MLDPHTAAFTAIATAVRALLGSTAVSVYPETMANPALFPSVFVAEIDNPETARDLSNGENATAPMLQIDVFSNKTSGNLTERKSIASTIDTTLRNLGYNRVMYNSNMPNIDETIKRTTMRYTTIYTS